MIDHVESAIRQVMGVIVKILGIALLITVVVQVVSRYFPVTMVWTDELSRFLFVWFSMLAIALAESLLSGNGVARVHGGGFGGTIQAFVPTDWAQSFAEGMDAVFGEGACGVYGVDHEGAKAWWM